VYHTKASQYNGGLPDVTQLTFGFSNGSLAPPEGTYDNDIGDACHTLTDKERIAEIQFMLYRDDTHEGPHKFSFLSYFNILNAKKYSLLEGGKAITNNNPNQLPN